MTYYRLIFRNTPDGIKHTDIVSFNMTPEQLESINWEHDKPVAMYHYGNDLHLLSLDKNYLELLLDGLFSLPNVLMNLPVTNIPSDTETSPT